MVFIQVAVPVPIRQLFTYQHAVALPSGVRVAVPFGPRSLIGVVVAQQNEADVENINKIKPIEKVIDDTPVIDGVLMKMAQWLWQYYHHAPGEVLHAMLPVLLRKGESAQPSNRLTSLQQKTGTCVNRRSCSGHQNNLPV